MRSYLFIKVSPTFKWVVCSWWGIHSPSALFNSPCVDSQYFSLYNNNKLQCNYVVFVSYNISIIITAQRINVPSIWLDVGPTVRGLDNTTWFDFRRESTKSIFVPFCIRNTFTFYVYLYLNVLHHIGYLNPVILYYI